MTKFVIDDSDGLTHWGVKNMRWGYTEGKSNGKRKAGEKTKALVNVGDAGLNKAYYDVGKNRQQYEKEAKNLEAKVRKLILSGKTNEAEKAQKELDALNQKIFLSSAVYNGQTGKGGSEMNKQIKDQKKMAGQSLESLKRDYTLAVSKAGSFNTKNKKGLSNKAGQDNLLLTDKGKIERGSSSYSTNKNKANTIADMFNSRFLSATQEKVTSMVEEAKAKLSSLSLAKDAQKEQESAVAALKAAANQAVQRAVQAQQDYDYAKKRKK